MKKTIFVSMVFVLSLISMLCFVLFQKESLPIEMVAFNSLTQTEQDKIPVSPKDSTVKKVVVQRDAAVLTDQDYNGKKVYAVTFNHTATDSLGDLVVYVDLNKHSIAGKGFSHKKE